MRHDKRKKLADGTLSSFMWLDSIDELLKLAPTAKDYPDLVQQIRDGWLEGADRISATMVSLQPPSVQGIRRRPTWKDSGDEVCMDKVRSGNLDSAWHGVARRLGQQAPRVRVVCDASMLNFSTHRDVFFLRGAAACRLTDSLSEAGYQVELWASDGVGGGYGGRPRVGLSWIIKPFDAPFDLASAAAGCALDRTYRHIAYSMFLKIDEMCAGGATPMIPDFFEEENTRVFIVPDSVITVDKANDWIKACIDTLEASYAAEREARVAA